MSHSLPNLPSKQTCIAMPHFKDDAHFSGLRLLTVTNSRVKPQDTFPYRTMVGVDTDGETVREFDLKAELEGHYFVIFFFPMDFTVDSEEICSFKASLEGFSAEKCDVLGVTADSPLAVRRWVTKSTEDGGFGGPPGFPILTDKDLALSMSLCVARYVLLLVFLTFHNLLLLRDCGVPARATFIVNWDSSVRYMQAHRTDIPR